MRTSCRSRLAATCRRTAIPSLVAIVTLGAAVGANAADRLLAGIVVDQSGQSLPRAYVRLVDDRLTEIAATFSDEAGRFRSRRRNMEPLGYLALRRATRAGVRVAF